MFGLEKQPGEKFAFELEKEIKENPSRGKEILDSVEQKIQEIKQVLRTGANEKDFDRLGILLHGYVSMQKVLKKVTR
jgi:transcription termination factor NusB